MILALMILGYLATAIATLGGAAHVRSRFVAELKKGSLDRTSYTFEHTKRQKTSREFCEVIMIFCLLWPLEFVAGLLYGLARVGIGTVKWGIHKVEESSQEVIDRKQVKMLEDERERVLNNSANGELSSTDEARLTNLDSMIFHRQPQIKALISGKS